MDSQYAVCILLDTVFNFGSVLISHLYMFCSTAEGVKPFLRQACHIASPQRQGGGRGDGEGCLHTVACEMGFAVPQQAESNYLHILFR